MYWNCNKLTEGMNAPVLRLRTLSGRELGPIPFVHNLRFTIQYSDVSTISFTVPYMQNGRLNPLYGALSSYMVVYTEAFGIYVLSSPTKSGDGISETKKVTGYSLEHLFSKKDLFLEEGTYNFWNPVSQSDTILGRILELDSTWVPGYVSPRLIDCYRTFDQYDSDALGFCYGDAMEKYKCVFVFDVYGENGKTINVYDATEDAPTVPIYLDYNNLVNTVGVEEITDNMATKLHLYGADRLSIRGVNPTGEDYIVDLGFFIQRGDMDIKAPGSDKTLADRVREWTADIASKQAYYTGLSSLQSSTTARKLSAEAELAELNVELESLNAQQSVMIQTVSIDKTQQSKLDEINGKISVKKAEISEKKSQINTIQGEVDGYTADMKGVVEKLSFSSYFTPEERKILNLYLLEGTLEEETFVSTDIDPSVSGAMSKTSGTVSIAPAKNVEGAVSQIAQISLADFGRTMYTLSGGVLSIPSSLLSADIVRGTLDIKSGESAEYVLTASLGKTSYGDHTFQSGLITINGNLSGLSSDIAAKTENEVTEYVGTSLNFSTTSANTYFTVNAGEFQRYSVAMELYDFGTDVLGESAWPDYEFNIDSANFLYQKKFAPFKDRLKLGSAIHLKLGSDGVKAAKLIGVELDFEDITKFNMTFSNRYQLQNGVEKWIDEIRSTTRSSGRFDANKSIYNLAANKTTQVDMFMQGLQHGTVDAIVSAKNKSVVFDGGGIHVGGDSNYQMRIIDNMIAMTKDGWQHVEVAIGRFSSPEGGETWGVNAELLAGKLIIGNSMVLQNPILDENNNPTGAMMFKVDGTGAWLYNSRIVLQGDNGLMLIDPKYGIAAGTNLLFDTNGTTVTPEFMDQAGDIAFDSDGMPKNANFFLDINDGGAYFRGKLLAKSGRIGGYTIEDGYLHSGEEKSYVALNGGVDVYPAYAIWAGHSSPDSLLCPFWVKKDGSMKAKNGSFDGGTFTDITANGGNFNDITASRGNFQNITVDGASTFNGILNAPKLTGTMNATNGWIEGCGIKVGKNDNVSNGYNFYVDSNGNVTINGGSISWDAITGTGAINQAINNAQSTADSAQSMANSAYALAQSNTLPSYIKSTYIDATTVQSPTLQGNIVVGGTFIGSTFKAQVSTGANQGFVLSTNSYGDIFRIYFNDMGGFGPQTVIRGNGGTLTFSNWSHIDGINVTATFA